MAWEVVPQEDISKVVQAVENSRCVTCYGDIDKACSVDHGFYCCRHDDTGCCVCPGVDDECPRHGAGFADSLRSSVYDEWVWAALYGTAHVDRHDDIVPPGDPEAVKTRSVPMDERVEILAIAIREVRALLESGGTDV